jgi:ATP/maltotriose-dependent transcriptional regulator MalT
MGRRMVASGAVEMSRLEYGRACYDRRGWRDAYEALRSADSATPLDVDDLDRLATAAYLTGREAEFQQILDRLYRAHVAAANRSRAARCTFWLAITYLIRGERGRSNAWVARGQRLVEDGEHIERGYLAIVLAEQQLRDGHADAARATAGDAFKIGESARDADLLALARHAEGRALIQGGEVLAGLTCLDETMLAVVADELLPIMTGLMYCSVIDTCRQVYALGRACEWTSAFSSMCQQQPEMVAFTGACLVHRAEILQLQGAWPEALTEACQACERSQSAGRTPPAGALYQRGEIHRLRGEYAEAEEAYRAASRLGFEPQPGLALLRLAQGRTRDACTAIRRVTSATHPSWATGGHVRDNRMRRARLLPAYLEIMLVAGNLDEARDARDELRELAERFDADMLRAVVAQADGAIAIAEGNPHAALDPLRDAFDIWMCAAAPYDAARVRVLIGEACRAVGDIEAASLELEAARAVFARLGVPPESAHLNAATLPASCSPLTARELHVLRLISGGGTNKEIATELSVSERTVDRHVANILTKLDVRSRTAATAYAYDHKLW